MRVPGRVVLTEAALASLLALVAHEVPGVVGMAPAGLKDQVGRILGRQPAGPGCVVAALDRVAQADARAHFPALRHRGP